MQPDQKQTAHRFTSAHGTPLNYLLYTPDPNTTPEPAPLIMFLHGSGERGNNPDSVKTQGLPKYIEQGHNHPAYIVSPQCPDGQRWTQHLPQLAELLEFLMNAYPVDANRVYLTGLSLGGEGTWALAAAYPQLFAALVPVCGRSYPDKAPRLKALPVWVFHGAKDDVVPPEESVRMVDALKVHGADVTFTLYETLAHNSWDAAYATPELYTWLFAQRRNEV